MGPLEGIRIVDLSQVISGPLAATWLADQGAEVVKIEDRHGDPSRAIGARKDDTSALYVAVNRNKTGVALDLKSDEGRAAAWKLIDEADVLLQNFRPGVIDRLGFGYAEVARRNPQIVYCSISGYGADGPRSKARVYDAVVQASSGIAVCEAGADGQPDLIRAYVCDKATSLIAAQAITAALLARCRTGKGQLLELNLFDCAIAFSWPEGMWNNAFLDENFIRSPEVGASSRLWKTKDGYVALAVPQQKEFEGLCRAVGKPELIADPRCSSLYLRMQNSDALTKIMEEAIAQWSTTELDARLAAEDVPGSRVNSRDEVFHDPQALSNQSFTEIDGGDLGKIRAPHHPVRFHGTPVDPVLRPAPRHAGRAAQLNTQKSK